MGELSTPTFYSDVNNFASFTQGKRGIDSLVVEIAIYVEVLVAGRPDETARNSFHPGVGELVALCLGQRQQLLGGFACLGLLAHQQSLWHAPKFVESLKIGLRLPWQASLPEFMPRILRIRPKSVGNWLPRIGCFPAFSAQLASILAV